MKRPVALVTGSSRGFGREIVLRFARGGWNVVVNHVRSAGKSAEVAAEAESVGAEAVVVGADVGNPASPERLVGAAMDAWGRLDCLVNNAGIGYNMPFTKLTEIEWDEVMGVNLFGPLKLIRRAAGVMRPGASVVNICSMCGIWGCAGSSEYSASKAALAALAPGLAGWLRECGIRINGVAPGYMLTDMGGSLPRAMERAKSQHVMHRFADPAGAAEFVYQLAGMPSVSGQLFVLDGRINSGVSWIR